MFTYTFKTRTVKGEAMELTVPIEGIHPTTKAPILELKMMADEHWNALAAGQSIA